jgi:hypothetical protein
MSPKKEVSRILLRRIGSDVYFEIGWSGKENKKVKVLNLDRTSFVLRQKGCRWG